MVLRNGVEGCSSSPQDEACLVIEGGSAITMVPGRDPVSDARIVVFGDRIADIGAKSEVMLPQDGRYEIIDAGNSLVLPGLVNTHNHAAMTLFRGLADDLPLREWLFDRIFPAEAKWLDPNAVYWGALLGCLEMIASGTTCFADGYFFEEQTVRAVDSSGLRGLIAQGVLDFPAPGVPDPKENIQIAKAFVEKWLGFSDRITPGIFCHSPLTCSERTLTQAEEISQAHGLRLQIHLSETQQEIREIVERSGRRPVHYLDSLGLLNRSLIAAHGIYLDPGEIARLAETGVNIAHVPESNMKLGSGVARVEEMMRAGITLGLGTDGCASNNDLDMFCEMETAAKLAKVFNQDPLTLNADQALELATIGGAAVLGLESEIGTLEKGKRADIIVASLDAPHLQPLYEPVSALVYSANGGDVRDVVVNGRVLMRDRRFTTIDADEVMAKVNDICVKIREWRN